MDQSTSALNEKRSVDDIERDIHRTQQEMSRTIDSIQYRLSPGYIKSRAREQMKNKSRGMMDRIKENPAAAAIAGAGLFMLFRGDSKSDSSSDYEAYGSSGADYGTDYGYVMICDACGFSVHEHEGQGHGFTERARDRMNEAGSKAKGKMADLKHSASDAAHSVSDKADDAKERIQESAGRMSRKAHDASRRARQQARRTGRKAQQRFDQDPLLMGAIGIAAGALLGAMIPESDRERELMGDTRDEFVERGKQLAREKGEQVRRVAKHAKDAAVEEAKQESKRQDLTGEGREERVEPGLGRPTV